MSDVHDQLIATAADLIGLCSANTGVGRERLSQALGAVVASCALLADHVEISRDTIAEEAHRVIAKFKLRSPR